MKKIFQFQKIAIKTPIGRSIFPYSKISVIVVFPPWSRRHGSIDFFKFLPRAWLRRMQNIFKIYLQQDMCIDITKTISDIHIHFPKFFAYFRPPRPFSTVTVLLDFLLFLTDEASLYSSSLYSLLTTFLDTFFPVLLSSK